MNYTSALAMHFRSSTIIYFLLFLISSLLNLNLHLSMVYGADSEKVIEGVVAVIDDEVITRGEYREKYSDMKKRFPEIRPEEVIDMMINRILLLREARRMGILKKLTDDEIISEYIDIKLRASVFITEEELVGFYNKNKEQFGDMSLEDVQESIEYYLREEKTNRLLEDHIRELRRTAYIRRIEVSTLKEE